MKNKTFPPRRSSTLLRRIASAALLLLTFHTAAMAITITLKPGRGSGSDIVIYSEDRSLYATDVASAANGQFWEEGTKLWFRFPDCPGSFTARGDDVFLGWTIDSEDGATLSPGTQYQISKELTLYAQWGVVEFDECTDFATLKYTVTNTSPREVSLIGFEVPEISDFSIPASVHHDGEEYAVTGIGDECCKENDDITALTIPATVRSIGSEAFYDCENLTTLTFAEGSQLESIGENAFRDCHKLTSVYSIPGSVKATGSVIVFRGCPLEIVTIVGHGNYSDYSFKYLFQASAVQVTLPSNEAGGAKWTTFYTPKCNFQADDATTVYKAELVGSTLLLHEVQDRIINKENAVILKSTGNPVLTKTEAESTDASTNDLLGSNGDLDTPTDAYVLYGGAEGLGFYPYSGAMLQAGKAYVVITSGSGVKGFVGMTETPDIGTTAIPSMPAQEAAQDEAAPWYTIDGRRLPARPARPGIYIRSGRKAVIR